MKTFARKGNKRYVTLPSQEAPSAKKLKVPTPSSSSSDALANVPDPDIVPYVSSSQSKEENFQDLKDLIPSEENC